MKTEISFEVRYYYLHSYNEIIDQFDSLEDAIPHALSIKYDSEYTNVKIIKITTTNEVVWKS